MSRKVRHSFAAPLVVTLAVGPACVVRSSPAPQQPTPVDPPGPVMNPPRPVAPTEPTPDRAPNPDTAPDTVAQTDPPPEFVSRTWEVRLDRSGATCRAYVPVVCQPKATCNPPPPRAIDCPDGITVERPVRVMEQAPGECYALPEVTPCPKDMACNPPPPRKTACPT